MGKYAIMKLNNRGDDAMKVSVGVSARHVHLTRETYIKLFGDDYIEKVRDLDQPGQYASASLVAIKNGDEIIPNVRVLGPFRNYNQVEISRTDAFKLKVEPPIRTSGDLVGSLPITLVGPLGEVMLDEGLIIANRHIHITPLEKERYGLQDLDKVCIKVDGEKGGILKNVYLKVLDEAALRLHLDTDDANAFNLKDNDSVEVLIER